MAEQKRTITDKIVCGYNYTRFQLTEPVLVRVNRVLNEYKYKMIDEDPLISVYVPTYNRAEILMERAVPTVLAQTYRNFEFIIVGDHCTDKTEEYVSKINDYRFRFYNIAKRGYRYPPTAENHWLAGPVVAANTALNMVQGKWIARLDDDDIWTEDHLEILLRFAQQGGHEFVSSSYIAERNGEKTIIDAKDEVPRIGGTQTWLYRSYLRFFKYNINCWRKTWNRVNDTDLQERIGKAGVRIGFIDKVTCKIIPRPGETTIGIDAYRETADEKEKHFEFS
jgi:glycosyltransferase involved in cell wall biosynthesis